MELNKETPEKPQITETLSDKINNQSNEKNQTLKSQKFKFVKKVSSDNLIENSPVVKDENAPKLSIPETISF